MENIVFETVTRIKEALEPILPGYIRAWIIRWNRDLKWIEIWITSIKSPEYSECEFESKLELTLCRNDKTDDFDTVVINFVFIKGASVLETEIDCKPKIKKLLGDSGFKVKECKGLDPSVNP